MSISSVKQENIPPPPPDYSILDTKRCREQVWLAKLPSFIYNHLINNPAIEKGQHQLGTIKIEQQEGSKMPKVFFTLKEGVIANIPKEKLPLKYSLDFDQVCTPNQYIFSHNRESGFVRIVGKVSQFANITAVEKGKLATLRAYLIEQDKKKKQKLDRKPDAVIEHPEQERLHYRRGEREVMHRHTRSDAREKMPEDELRQRILEAFKEQPQWTQKELVERIDQPADHVRRVLSAVARYNNATQFWEKSI